VIARREGRYGIVSYVDTMFNNNILGNFDASWHVQQNVYRNNIITGSKEEFRWVDYYNKWIVKNNDVWDVKTISNRGPLDLTNIYKDPMFVNSGADDYHLQAYSPLIDADSPEILDTDGSRSDFGAYGGPQGSSYIYKDYPSRVTRGLQITASGNELTITWVKNTEADFNYYSNRKNITVTNEYPQKRANYLKQASEKILVTHNTGTGVLMIRTENIEFISSLVVTDILGNAINLKNISKDECVNVCMFDAQPLSSGVYIIIMKADQKIYIEKFIVVK